MTQAKTFTMELSDREKAVLEDLAKEKAMTQAQLMRQALRLYQVIDERLKRGAKIFVDDGKNKVNLEFL